MGMRSVTRHILVHGTGPCLHASRQIDDTLEVPANKKRSNNPTTHTVMANDDDLIIRIEFIDTSGQFIHGYRDTPLNMAEIILIWLSDIQE